jgi:hypothetical protein
MKDIKEKNKREMMRKVSETIDKIHSKNQIIINFHVEFTSRDIIKTEDLDDWK